MVDERVLSLAPSLLTVLIRLAEELFKPTKLALPFPQIIQLLLILAGHGSEAKDTNNSFTRQRDGYPSVSMFSKRKTNHETTACSTRIFSKAVLIFWPIWTTSSSCWDISPRRTSPSNLMTTTTKEYANQHWYHCHSCKMIERVGICQICANVFSQRSRDLLGQVRRVLLRWWRERRWRMSSTRQTSNEYDEHVAVDASEDEIGIEEDEQRQQGNIDPSTTTIDASNQVKERHLSIAGRFFEYLQSSLVDHYQMKRSSIDSNRFDLIETFVRCNEHVNIDSSDSSSTLFNGVLHSQENTFESFKLSFTNEHGQQIKQLLSRQGMSVNLVEQRLIVSEEKGKQAMISILKFTSLLFSESQHDEHEQQCLQWQSNEEEVHVGISWIRWMFHSLFFPCKSINWIVPRLSLTGLKLKDCQVWNIDNHGRLKEPTIVVQPNLDSSASGNYIIRAQWLLDRLQTQLVLLTTDFIKIFDVSVDPISDFILPTGKVRNWTFYYSQGENNVETCLIFIIASNGSIIIY